MAKTQYLTENLRTAHMGNGIVVFDVSREKRGDYVTVAHISVDREIYYYKARTSPEQRDFIEKFAKDADPQVSHCQSEFVFNARPVKDE
ncbi:MAG: hypothetical protein ABJH04_07850 [Cyclobacteriaceae bacterium]